MTWRRWGLVVVAVAYIGAVGAGARYLEELRIGGGYGETVDGGMDIDHEGNLWTDGTIYYDVEDLSTGGAAGTVPMSDGDGTLTMTPVDTADIPDTEAELELHLTDVTDVVTNNDAYYQYFIDSAGTTGQVWTSDGSGKGGWSTLSAATDLLVSADNYVPPLGYNYERNDYLYIRGGTGITTSIDDVLSGPRITISRSAASWSAAADSGTNQTIAESGTITLAGSTTAATKGIATSTDTGKVVFALPSGSSGQVLKHDGTAWVAGTDTTGGTMSSFNFGVSGHMIPVVNGYNLYCYGLRGITVETISGTWGIFNIGLPTATTTGQVLKWDGSAWVAGTDSGTTYTAGTGLNLSGTTFALQHLGWESLADPNADRIGFWDDSAGAMKWLTVGSNLAITDTTIAATDANTTYSAGNGLALSSTTFRLTDGSVSGQILKWDGDSWELASDETGSQGSMSFTLAGDSGTSQTIADTNTMSVLGGRGISTVASATDTLTINLPTGSNGQVLKSNGTTWAGAADNDTTYSAFTGDSGSGGAAGLVPAPGAGDAAASKYLKADGTWATVGGGSLPSGTEHQTLRHNGTTWAATSGMLSTGSLVTITGPNSQYTYPLKVLTPRDNVNDTCEIEFGTSQPNGEDNNPYGVIGIKITNNSQYSRAGTIQIRPGSNSALVNGVSVTGADTTIHGVLKAGTTPTTVTNASGKVLMSALEKITYNTQWLHGNTYIWNSSNFTAGTGGADENDLGGRYLQQTSTGADAYAWAWVSVPSDFTSGDSVKLTAYFTADTTDTSAMYVGLAATYIADGGAVLASSGATPQYSAVTLASTGLKSATYTYSSFSATAGGLVAINLHRDDDNGSDTSTNKMRFFGMSVEFER